MSLYELEKKQSTPLMIYSTPIGSTKSSQYKRAVFGEDSLMTIPYFLGQNQGDCGKTREFLLLNRIGNVFDDLQPGRAVFIPIENNPTVSFPLHPEA